MSLFKIRLGSNVESLFIHIPKTGGTSIREGRQLSECRVYEPDKAWLALPSFAFVRNPFDRLVSCWVDFRFNRRLVEWDFETFLRHVTRVDVEEAVIADPQSIEHYAAPMTHPVHGLKYAWFVGRYESLQQDFDIFVVDLGIPRIELPRLRQLPTWNGPMLNTPDNLRLVYTHYKADYELYESIVGVPS